ncbi:MAG: hypothetical protein ACMUIP_05695 [bacterium]
MQTGDLLKSKSIFLLALSIIFTLSFILSPALSIADIPISSYCQLSIQSMELEIAHLKDLIALINQYQGDSATLDEQLAAKRAEYDQITGDLYASFETTANEFVTYMGKHGREVDTYLESNTDIKQQMDNYISQINTLLSEYESLKADESEEEPPPPLP